MELKEIQEEDKITGTYEMSAEERRLSSGKDADAQEAKLRPS